MAEKKFSEQPIETKIEQIPDIDEIVNKNQSVIDARVRADVAKSDMETSEHLKNKLFNDNLIASVEDLKTKINDVNTKLADLLVRESTIGEREQTIKTKTDEISAKLDKDTKILNEINLKYKEIDKKKREVDDYITDKKSNIEIEISNQQQILNNLKTDVRKTIDGIVEEINGWGKLAQNESNISYSLASKSRGSESDYHNKRSNALWSIYLELKEIVRKITGG